MCVCVCVCFNKIRIEASFSIFFLVRSKIHTNADLVMYIPYQTVDRLKNAINILNIRISHIILNSSFFLEVRVFLIHGWSDD